MNPTIQLLLDAAKAIGITDADFHGPIEGIWSNEMDEYWNPLEDDGDALRLAVKLSQMEGGVALMLNSRLNSTGFAQCYTSEYVIAPSEYMSSDPFAAARLVIVKAAAEIGKRIK